MAYCSVMKEHGGEVSGEAAVGFDVTGAPATVFGVGRDGAGGWACTPVRAQQGQDNRFKKQGEARIRQQKTYPLFLYAPWVRFAILTGLRQKEQFTLKWKHVDLEVGLMTLPETKAGGAVCPAE